MGPGMLDSLVNGPRTALPQFGRNQQRSYNSSMGNTQNASGYAPQYTADQVLAPPQLQVDDQGQENMDPNLHAQLMLANAYLTDQQQRLQQQLRELQAAAQQFQGLNLNNQVQMMRAYPNVYQQQQQLQSMQQMMTGAISQPNIYSVYDPVTGQQTLYVDQSQTQANAQFFNQAHFGNAYAGLQQQQQQAQQINMGTPRVQVSPPPEAGKNGFRNPSPPRRFESPIEQPIPLPPPSANAFRRGHKKSNSLANANKGHLLDRHR